MGSLERKLARKQEKEAKKQMAKKMNIFDSLPDKCTTCDKPFDKKSKEDTNTWHVTVFEEAEKVGLFCPTCWEAASD